MLTLISFIVLLAGAFAAAVVCTAVRSRRHEQRFQRRLQQLAVIETHRAFADLSLSDASPTRELIGHLS